MDIEFILFVQIHQILGCLETEYTLPPTDFFAGGEHEGDTTKNINAPREDTALRGSDDY